MNKQRALYLLDKGFNEGEREVALVHGTSTATAMEIMRKGFLPAANNGRYDGWIYFYPVQAHMHAFNFYNSLREDLDMKLAEKLATAAAESNEQYAYLNGLLGFSHWEMPLFEGRIQYGDMENEEELWGAVLEAKAQEKIDKSKLKDILKERQKCRGVIVGINKKIIEDCGNAVEIDPEEYRVPERKKAAVRIHLPRGLEQRFLQYIYPLGDREDKLIRNFIEEELK